MFEYVERKEYEPVKEEIERIIKEVQKEVQKEVRQDGAQFAFQFELVGSGKQKLVTREVNGNRGFDFDYNLIINEPDEECHWVARFARETLLEAFQKVLKDSKYKVENSTSVITIKSIDRANSKIIHSCDFAVIRYELDRYYGVKKYYFAKKNNGEYVWNERSVKEICEKFEWVKKYYWDEFRRMYLELKNKQLGKKSFSLRLEAINNICNSYGYYE